MDMASRTTKGADDTSGADDNDQAADAGQPTEGNTHDLVREAFERSQVSPIHPAVGTPNPQPGTADDGLPTAVGRQRLHLEVRMTGRFEWAVFKGDEQLSEVYGKETEAYDQKARLEREDTGGSPLVSVF